MAKILLIEDDMWLAELYISELKNSGHEIFHARTAQESMDLLDKNNAEIILLDIMLPEHNGIEVLHELQSYEDWNDIPVVLLSTISPQQFRLSQKQWEEYGVVKYLYKPQVKPNDLALIIEGLVADE